VLRQHIPSYSAREKGENQGRQLHLITAPHLRAAIERAKSGHDSFDPALPAAQKQTCTLIYQLVESIFEKTNMPG
jgi:hypothetical protein